MSITAFFACKTGNVNQQGMIPLFGFSTRCQTNRIFACDFVILRIRMHQALQIHIAPEMEVTHKGFPGVTFLVIDVVFLNKKLPLAKCVHLLDDEFHVMYFPSDSLRKTK